jgi:hypothetical protein
VNETSRAARAAEVKAIGDELAVAMAKAAVKVLRRRVVLVKPNN